MTAAGFVQGKGGNLSHIVEQGSPAQGKICRNTGDHMGHMGVKIIGVMGAALIKADHGLQLRNHRCQNGREMLEVFCGYQRQQLAQFLKYPFPGQTVHAGSLGEHGLFRDCIHLQSEAHRKTDAS